MATIREVMAVGTAYPLARMLGSNEYAVEAEGTDQASATLLEGNFVLIESATGEDAGVRLKSASGQFIHAIINLTTFVVWVYPDGSETINGMLPGHPFVLEGGDAMIAIPARRQWIAGGGAAVAAAPGVNPAVHPQAAYYQTDGSVISGAAGVAFPNGDSLCIGDPPPPSQGPGTINVTGNFYVNGQVIGAGPAGGGVDTVALGITATGQTLTAQFNEIVAAGAGSAVGLPSGTGWVAGSHCLVRNGGANSVNVNPPAGARINQLAVGAAMSVIPNTTGYFEMSSATQWYSVP
jgi:hypothetical protein